MTLNLKTLNEYLPRYSEPEALLTGPIEGLWNDVVAVPSFKERALLPRLIGSLREAAEAAESHVLAIIVVNAPEDASEPVREDSAATHAWLTQAAHGTKETITPAVTLLRGAPLSLLVVDRWSPGRGFPPKQGVGLARKIGCDMALGLALHGRWQPTDGGRPFIYTTDGDVLVPKDYFLRARRLTGPLAVSELGGSQRSALIFPYEHVGPESEERCSPALALYEASLRYYELGMQYAASPYAFQTVGSTLAIDAMSYAKVRGFPRRDAAEDFYLLNKLAKTGPIDSLSGDPLRIAERHSDRVPFGTGQALRKLEKAEQDGIPFTVYDPRTFSVLKATLAGASAAINEQDESRFDRHVAGALSLLNLDQTPIQAALESCGLRAGLQAVMGLSPRRDIVQRHFHTWFDSFRTLKLVHALRDHAMPTIGLAQAMAQAPFIEGFHGGAKADPWEILQWFRIATKR